MILLFVLNWRLSLLVVVGYIAMFWFINYSTQRSRAYYARQQASLGELDAYMEEMIAGQKVVKVFNHQQADMAAFAARNESLRQAGTSAQSYAATMVPAVVSIGYINYAVIAVVGGLMVMWGWSDLGSLASYLVFVRQTTLPINQLNPAGQLFVGGAGGRGEYLYGYGGKARGGRGHGGAGPRAGGPGRHPDRGTGSAGPLGVVRPQPPGGAARAAVRRCGSMTSAFGYTPERMILQNLLLRKAGAEDCLCRFDRRGQNHHYQPHQPLL